jgi:hypothetical protein
MRGLFPALEDLHNQGVQVVGYTETSISMAGWGVAWMARELGMTPVIFDPQYKTTPPVLSYHRRQWAKFNAVVIPIQAGIARVGWNVSRNLLREKYGPGAVLLPLGLPFEHSVVGTYREAVRTREACKEVDSCRHVVVVVGSGTMTAGVLRAFPDKTVWGIMCRTGGWANKLKTISGKSGLPLGSKLAKGPDFRLVDPGWGYTDRSVQRCPFPCHPYYDRKAWQWLEENENQLEDPVLFWNIGSMGRRERL